MRTRLRLIWLPLMLVAACGSPSSPDVVDTPPPAVSAPVVAGPVATPVAGDARYSCSSAAPTSFRITSGERVNDRWKNVVIFAPVNAVASYVLDLRNREAVTHSLTLTPTDFSSSLVSFEQYEIGDGVWSATLRSTCPDAQAAATVFSNGCGFGCSSNVPPPATPPAPQCTSGKHGCKR